MTTVSKTHCDNCKHDLSETNAITQYGLSLSAFQIPNRSGTATMAVVYPPVDATKHFCGLSCLEQWYLKLKGQA